MNAIAHNPYRVLGMFANDPLRTETANIARIRAFNKVGKECPFESDFTDIFGSIDRSEEAIEHAITLLSSDDDRDYYSSLWIHRVQSLDAGAKAPVDIIRSGLGGDSKACIVNVIVGAFYADNIELASEYIIRLFECDDAPAESTKERFLVELENGYKDEYEWPPFVWWSRLRDICNREEGHSKTLEFISKVYNKESINYLRQISDSESLGKDCKGYMSIASAHNIAKPVVEVIKETSNQQTKQPNAEAQIVLSKYAKAVLAACKKYYNDTRFWEAKPVEKLLELLREVYRLSYSSKVKDECTAFGKEVKKELQFLAPPQVSTFSTTIRKEIETFCNKPNETRWSLQLLRNCVSPLIEIKTILGADNPYYKRISTQIADNALYASEYEIDSAERKLNNPRNDKVLALSNLINALGQATQLCVDINVLDIEDDFRTTKVVKFKDKIDNCTERNKVKVGDTKPSISLESHDDIYQSCNDYKSLMDFTLSYPDSPHFKEAIQRIWKIEDDEYPKDYSITAKALLAYKEKFPNSHNDQKILDSLDKMLLGRGTLGTVYDYRTMLRLWPDHPKKSVMLGRLDLASYKMCHNIEGWTDYLKEFPNGLYREEAIKHIQEIKDKEELEAFNRCQTIKDFCRFVSLYPSGKLHIRAINKIEDLYYSQAIQSGQYDTYFHQYPNGRYVKALNQLIDDKRFESCKTKDDYKNYIRLYPQGTHVPEAKKYLRDKRQKKIIVGSSIVGILFLFGFIAISIQRTREYDPSMSTVKNVDSSGQSNQSEDNTSSYINGSNDSEISDGNSDYSVESDKESVYNNEQESNENINNSYDAYRNNSLETGSKPYASYFGKAKTGKNFIDFKTSGSSDYIAIVKRHSNNSYINHVYIKGGDKARLYVPSGTYDVYFYSGSGWNPDMEVGRFRGGFVEGGITQKDGPIQLVSETIEMDDGQIQERTAYMEYTLYPVVNGNLILQSADIDNVLN
ncbi:MAG: hypothetical protein IKG96_00255 [Bacteroidaceae bacterium]|nr:hypothetical protein [Bacteroidaceae bacterium]